MMSEYWYVVRDYRGDDDGEQHGPVDVIFDDPQSLLDACKRDFCEDVAMHRDNGLERGARISAIYDTPLLCGTPWYVCDAHDNDKARAMSDEYREYDDFPLDGALRSINYQAGRVAAYVDMFKAAQEIDSRAAANLEMTARSGIRDAVGKLMDETDTATFFWHDEEEGE